MKHLLIITSLLLSGTIMAQTKVIKQTAVKSNNYGITYSLPKTALAIKAEVTKVTCEAGPYYKYAEKYLGVKDAVTENKVYYELGKVTLTNKGIPDPDQTYMVEFKAGTVAPYVYLTEEGLLCSINAEYEPEEEVTPRNKQKTGEQSSILPTSIYSEELLMAGSTNKEAEIAARQIYRIRESRLNILTGEADNLPPDGEAMRLVIEQLEAQEKALTDLFTGSITRETTYQDFEVIPYDNIDRDVLFRFSNRLGILDPDDLGGVPVYINLKATERVSMADSKEIEKKQKALKGVVYNLPGKANVEISMNKNTLFKGEVQVVQFGSREGLAPVMFEDKKAPVKVYFYPETGALKQVIQ
ncbi:MAG: DUF4831 family protein [Tannerellaceae bacterium]|nr:DUF4831 family protein [Tannerellaceae bacterium]